MEKQLLICKCGDCKHWEIGKDDAGDFIKCTTCRHVFRAKITVNRSTKISYAPESVAASKRGAVRRHAAAAATRREKR